MVRLRNGLMPFALGLLLGAGVAAGQDCNPDQLAARFTPNEDGTVTDGTTGLTWKRCSEGQSWDGTTCTGDAARYDWREAMALDPQSGEGGWRLPTLDELASITDKACSPAVDPGAFRATPVGIFWSSATDANNADYPWCLHLRDGHASKAHKGRGGHVRLVRVDPDSPKNDGRAAPRPHQPESGD